MRLGHVRTNVSQSCIGHPDVLASYCSFAFTRAERENVARLHGIRCQLSGIEERNTLGEGNPTTNSYVASIRRCF